MIFSNTMIEKGGRAIKLFCLFIYKILRKEDKVVITKINSENYGLYQALFQDAELSLRADDTLPEEYRTIEIRDLDAYIANIEQLRKLEVEQYDHHFTTLPLDEPSFAIDANSRHIEIPGDFKKNGLAVIGDHLAEVIYFSIDRYYDTWDLLESGMHAMVQWVHVSGGKELEKGISPITEIDGTILVNDRKILLGWPIDNSITQNAGTIKFSVRFYKFESVDGENHLVFNMNTIPTTIEVKNGLNFMSDTGVPAVTPQDITNIFEKRFGPGFGYVNGGDGAETPWFIIPLSFYSVENDEPVVEEIVFTDEEEPIVADLKDGSLIIGLAAGGNGALTYSAHNKTTSEETDISNNYVHFVTEDTIADGTKVYYTHNLDDDSYSVAHLVAGDSLVPTQEDIDAHTELDDNDEPVLTADLNYYERMYIYEIEGVGTYCIKATNKVLPASTKHKESGKVLVPEPHDPEVDVDSAIFLDTTTNKFTIEMTGYTDQEINGVKDKISYTITQGEDIRDDERFPQYLP